MPIRKKHPGWTLAPKQITPAMCQAMLDAAAALGATVSGISPSALWDAALSACPGEPRVHRIFIGVREARTGFVAKPARSWREAGLVAGAKAASDEGPVEAVLALLKKSTVGLDAENALVLLAPTLPDDPPNVVFWEVTVDELPAAGGES